MNSFNAEIDTLSQPGGIGRDMIVFGGITKSYFIELRVLSHTFSKVGGATEQWMVLLSGWFRQHLFLIRKHQWRDLHHVGPLHKYSHNCSDFIHRLEVSFFSTFRCCTYICRMFGFYEISGL